MIAARASRRVSRQSECGSVDARKMIGSGDTATIAQQSTGRSKLAAVKDCRYLVANSDFRELRDFAQEERVAPGNDKTTGPQRQVSDDLVKFLLGAGSQNLELQPEGVCRLLRIADLDLGNSRIVRIDC